LSIKISELNNMMEILYESIECVTGKN